MEAISQGDLTPRQVLGVDYTEYNDDLPKEIHRKRFDKNYYVKISGKAKEPPEIENRSDMKAMVIYFDLDKFQIQSRKTGKFLDLVKITPEGWTQKVVDLTSPLESPPEVHVKIDTYIKNDFEENECVMNARLGGSSDLGNIVAISLWNTLVAKFHNEIGSYVNDEAGKAMSQVVLDRRTQVLASLNSSDQSDPQEIALKSFKE
jgi:hypothetical protein